MGTAREQGEIWGARAEDWANCNEPAWHGVFEAVLNETGVTSGTRYLDIGCGAGGALVLARGRGAKVTGFDASEALAAIASARLPGSEVLTGDMEELPFAPDSFDAVSAINAMQFAGSMTAALKEARRVTRRGGVFCTLVWGPRAASDILSGVMPGVFALLPPPAGPQAPPPPLGDAGVLDAMIEEAGFVGVKSKDLDAVSVFPAIETAVKACMSASHRAIRHAGEEAVGSTLTTALSRYLDAGGRVVLRNRFRMAAGRKA